MEKELREGIPKSRTNTPKLFLGLGEALEELNLVEFPLAVLSKHPPKDTLTVSFSDTIWDKSAGDFVNRKVTLTAPPDVGLATIQDQDVLLALMLLTFQKSGFAESKVTFTVYELCVLLGWEIGGRQYNRIWKALERWTAIYIRFENSWRKDDAWSTEGFSILQHHKIRGSKKSTAHEDQTFTWCEEVADSIRASNTRSIDWDFYLSLELPLAKRMYRFLDKRFHLRANWKFDCLTFAQEKLGLSRSYKPNQYKRKLQPAIDELVAKGFLAKMPIEKRFVRQAKGVFQVNFRRQRKKQSETKTQEPLSDLAKRLVERGVSNGRQLVKQFGEEKVRSAIENYDDRLAHGEDKGPGWLGASITTKKGDYGFRKGYKTKEELAAEVAKRQEVVAAKQEEHRRDLEERRRDEERLASERAGFVAYLDKFTSEQLDSMELDAIERARKEGETFLANLVLKARKQGESIRAASFTRQTFWNRFIQGKNGGREEEPVREA